LELALKNSRGVAIIISPEAVASGWVEEEYAAAIQLAKTKADFQVIPVILREAELPRFLQSRNWVDFRDETNYAQSVWKLVWGITGDKPAQVLDLNAPDLPPPTDSEALAAAERAYRQRLKERYAEDASYFVDPEGVTTEKISSKRQPKALQLALRHRQKVKGAEYHEWQQAGQEIKQVKLKSLRAGVDNYPCVILLGEPGSGKTTALENLAYELAAEDGQLPLPLRLSEFEPGMTVEAFIKQSLPDLLAANLDGYLQAGRLFVLFDALNEMPRAGYGQHSRALRNFIDHWSAKDKGNRFLVTCRVLDYGEELSGLQRVEVQPFDDQRIQEFIQNVLPDTWSGLWARLIKEEDKQRRLLEMVRNPYILTMMAVIYAEEGDLSSNRAELLGDFTGMLLAWAEEKTPRDKWLDAEVQAEALSILAFEMQKAGEGTSVKTYELELPEKIQPGRKMIASPPKDQVLTLAAGANIIEMPVERSTVRFYHQLLQEYFAARHMLKQEPAGLAGHWHWPWWLERDMPLWERPEDNWDPLPPPPQTGWEETTIIAAGLAAENDDQLVQALIEINPVLAGRCVHEGRAKVEAATRQAVIKALLTTIGNTEVALRVRIVAGEVLGELGDPRIGELVTIPAGEFLMGSDPDLDELSFYDERPQHELYLPEYQIGKYPVTNAEYAHFIEAGGYRDNRWWTEEGWAYLENPIYEEEVYDEDEPYYEPEPIYYEPFSEPRYWQKARCNKPNQPVVGVGWYDSVAYCRWLSAETGRQYRLPTEAEWEKAARGTDGRVYPWGNEFEANRLNVDQGKQQVRTTTPVGIYPSGVSPFGVFDCAGNVWEWCATEYAYGFKPYPYDAKEDEWAEEYLNRTNDRARRGGFWPHWGGAGPVPAPPSASSSIPGFGSTTLGFGAWWRQQRQGDLLGC
jgi:formylglycine-generating enzyme required for sulfatase activity